MTLELYIYPIGISDKMKNINYFRVCATSRQVYYVLKSEHENDNADQAGLYNITRPLSRKCIFPWLLLRWLFARIARTRSIMYQATALSYIRLDVCQQQQHRETMIDQCDTLGLMGCASPSYIVALFVLLLLLPPPPSSWYFLRETYYTYTAAALPLCIYMCFAISISLDLFCCQIHDQIHKKVP